MPRSFYINGETMVSVLGPVDMDYINVVRQLGLAADAIRVTLIKHSKPLIVDAYGQDNPIDEQVFGGEAIIDMNLIHFDTMALSDCVNLLYPGTTNVEGQLGRAGTPRGGPISGLGLYAAGTSFVSLFLSSPTMGLPYLFYAAFLSEQPMTIPLGTEKSVVQLRWRAIAYSEDPYGPGGLGSLGAPIYSRTNGGIFV